MSPNESKTIFQVCSCDCHRVSATKDTSECRHDATTLDTDHTPSPCSGRSFLACEGSINDPALIWVPVRLIEEDQLAGHTVLCSLATGFQKHQARPSLILEKPLTTSESDSSQSIRLESHEHQVGREAVTTEGYPTPYLAEPHGSLGFGMIADIPLISGDEEDKEEKTEKKGNNDDADNDQEVGEDDEDDEDDEDEDDPDQEILPEAESLESEYLRFKNHTIATLNAQALKKKDLSLSKPTQEARQRAWAQKVWELYLMAQQAAAKSKLQQDDAALQPSEEAETRGRLTDAERYRMQATVLEALGEEGMKEDVQERLKRFRYFPPPPVTVPQQESLMH